MKVLLTGGSGFLGSFVAEQLAADRLRCAVRQGYGMTESSGPIATMLIGSETTRRGSVGQLAPSHPSRCSPINSPA